MKTVYVAALVMTFGLLFLFRAPANAGTVSMTNNFSSAVRADISAGSSTGSLTAYPGETRNFPYFVSKSIDKIVVVDTANAARAPLGSYTVSSPSAAANFTIAVDTNGVAVITPALVP